MAAAKLNAMSDTLFAHTAKGRPWQKLQDHLENVAELCARFATAFDSAEAGKLIGLAHDLGKRDPAFQRYLRDGGQKCPHAYFGAKWLDEAIPTIGRLLAYTVAGHHAGLPDGLNNGCSSLADQLSKEAKNLSVSKKCPNPMSLLPPFLSKGDNRGWWLWIKMLYSCLVDADWLDTESFVNPEKAQKRPEHFDSLEALLTRFTHHMENVSAKAAKTPVNLLRAQILSFALGKAKKAKGIYSLTVPTGGGKTLTSLGFALTHAVAHGMKKIIYVIPYSTIIEQTSQTLTNVLGGQNVLEHHAEAKWREQKSEISNPLCQLTENWAGVPVVVTTNVQFFESLFSADSSRCRKIHNIVNSIIILDEAQKLPEDFLTPCAEALRLLIKNYGCTVLLCTATQPDLSMFGLNPVTELMPDVPSLYNQLRRVDYHDLGKIEELDEVARRIAIYPSALCVVNSRQDAKDLFSYVAPLVGEENTFHLSTWMCPKHRQDTVAKIRHRLSKEIPTYVVSTSLIEAGVDLDFPVVFRALAGIDSLAQAAGRCNREGRLEQDGQVFIFEKKPPRFLNKAFNEAKQIGDFENSLHQAETFLRYFRGYINMRCDTGGKWLEKLWVNEDLAERTKNSDPFGENIAFREVGKHFHLISEEDEVALFVPYNKQYKKRIRRVFAKGLTKQRLRQLRGACIRVFTKEAEALMSLSIPLKVRDLKSGQMVESPYRAVLDLKGLYSAKTGLNVHFETIHASDCIIDN